MNHTTANQDQDITAAESAAEDARTHTENLVAIIQDLDEKVTAWQDAAGVDDPRSLFRLLSDRETRIEELEGYLKEERRRHES